MPASFRRTVWDPRIIIAQIICIQSAHYAFQSLLITLMNILFIGKPVQLRYILSGEYSLRFGLGFSLLFAFLASSAFGGLMLLLLVGRAKYCLDFTLTLHGFHLIFSVIYNRFALPWTATWWLAWMASIICMDLSGEWLCMRYETEPVLLSTSPAIVNSSGAAQNTTTERLNSVLVIKKSGGSDDVELQGVKSQTPAAVRRCQMDGAPLNSPSPSLQNVTSIKRVASNPNLTPQKHE